MPKMRTNKAAQKRFKPTSKGNKIKRACMNKAHILNKKTRERKRKLRQGDYVHETQERTVRRMIGEGSN